MARLPRSINVVPGHVVHKIWRGHNKEFNLGSDADKSEYARFMNEDLESEKNDCGAVLQAMTIMGNHTHELFFIEEQEKFSDHMRRHHSRYGAYFNKKYNRSGKVAEDRPKTCLVESEEYEMIATFYVHANPLEAGITKDLRNYHYSTHNLYAFGRRNEWTRNVKLPRWYMKLGNTPEERQETYKRRFNNYLKTKNLVQKVDLLKLFFGSDAWFQTKSKEVKEWKKNLRRKIASCAPS